MAEPIVFNGNALDFQRDLGRLWRHVRRQQGLNITAQGWVYKSAFKALQAALNLPDSNSDEKSEPRLFFMRRMLMQTGDLAESGGGLLPSPNPQLFNRSMHERIKLCFEAWRDQSVWHEVFRIPPGLESDPRSIAPPDLARARMALLHTLASAVNRDEWLNFDKLVALLRQQNYDWLFPRNFRGRKMRGAEVYYQTPYYYNNNAYGVTFTNIKSEASGWDVVERQAMAVMFNGPLHWLGLVDVMHSVPRPDERTLPTAVRLTPIGSWLLRGAQKPELPETGGRLIVQPNFTILAIEPLNDTVLMTLDRFADVTGGDRAINYSINRQSVFRAQRSGMSVANVTEFLEQQQGNPIAANVRRTLEEWDALHRRITIHRRVRVLQFADVAARASALTAKIGQVVDISPQFVLAAAPKETLIGALEDAGWEPLITPAGSDDAFATALVQTDGNVTTTTAVPSLHTLAALDAISEVTPNGRRITRVALQNAMTQGKSLDTVLKQLQRVMGGQLPAELDTRLRTWAGFFGTGSLQSVALLELSSDPALKVLLADAAFAGLLRPIPGAEKPMALVPIEKIALVREMLLERGVTLA